MKKITFLLICMIFSFSYAQIEPLTTQDFVTLEEREPGHESQTLNINAQSIQIHNPNQYRRLYFLHGLGGNASSWQAASDACWDVTLNIPGFPARRVLVSRPEYTMSTSTTLMSAAYDVRQQIQNQAYIDQNLYQVSPEMAFIIAHSQGGLVTRALAHLDLITPPFNNDIGKGYGGFVTISSPLQGAQILNNRTQIEQFAEEGCTKLARGPYFEEDLDFWTNFFNIGVDPSFICNFFVDNALSIFFSDYYENITNDYFVGAPAIDLFNQDTNDLAYYNMPKLAFTGVEPRENLFWRTFNWVVNDVNNAGFFGANDDWNFYNTVGKPLYSKYSNIVAHYNNQISNYQTMYACLFPFLTPGGHMYFNASIKRLVDKKHAWQEGVDWLTGVNKKWEAIIGARVTTIETDTIYVCKNCVASTWVISYNIQDCYNKRCSTILPGEVSNLVTIYKENDGIVLRESAENLPGATHMPVIGNQILLDNNAGSSHMQVRNDEGLKQFLYSLFEGEMGMFFETAPIEGNSN